MARSSRTTPTGTATQAGRPKALKSPQPRASASRAKAMAPIGKTRRTRKVSRTTTAIFEGQRAVRAIRCFRRGVTSSQRAMPTRTPAKAARRMISLEERVFMGGARISRTDYTIGQYFAQDFPDFVPIYSPPPPGDGDGLLGPPRWTELGRTRRAPGWPPPPWGFAGDLGFAAAGHRGCRALLSSAKWCGEPVPALARFCRRLVASDGAASS